MQTLSTFTMLLATASQLVFSASTQDPTDPDVPYAAELLNGVRPGDTFDHCHFGIAGSQGMANLVAIFLRQNGITLP